MFSVWYNTTIKKRKISWKKSIKVAGRAFLGSSQCEDYDPKKFWKKIKKKSYGFQNLKITYFQYQSCEKGFSGPDVAVKVLESTFWGEKTYLPLPSY